MIQEMNISRTLVGRFELGDGLLESIQVFIEKENITAAWVNIIGGTKRFEFYYYNQETKEYETRIEEKQLEIMNATGNVSMKDGKPFPHIHITCGDVDGNAIGGHLKSGTTILAAEIIFWVLEGDPLKRVEHPATGLSLWECLDQ